LYEIREVKNDEMEQYDQSVIRLLLAEAAVKLEMFRISVSNNTAVLKKTIRCVINSLKYS